MTKYMVIFSGESKIVKVNDSNDKYLFDTFEEAHKTMIDDLHKELSYRYSDEESMKNAEENTWKEYLDGCWMSTSDNYDYFWQIISIEI